MPMAVSDGTAEEKARPSAGFKSSKQLNSMPEAAEMAELTSPLHPSHPFVAKVVQPRQPLKKAPFPVNLCCWLGSMYTCAVFSLALTR